MNATENDEPRTKETAMTVTEESKAAAIQDYLAQTTGTEHYYAHWMGARQNATRIVYTDGVKFVAETAGAYWLIDAILSHVFANPNLAREEFLVWTLKRNKTGSGAKLSCEDGNGGKLASQRIPYTDFPLPEIQFCVENGVLYLPEER